jgi:hypothetical protein
MTSPDGMMDGNIPTHPSNVSRMHDTLGLQPPTESGTVQPPRQRARLGEELPIFCEKCGYSLHGLPQHRCDHCQILQFTCPECGHHQPINTLRPAFQAMLGRVRAAWLAGVVFFKLNFLFWPLFGWVGMGVECSYSYRYDSAGFRGIETVRVDWEIIAAFTFFALAFGMVARMLLLRWRRGWAVGTVLAGLVLVALTLGARIQQWDHDSSLSPFSSEFLTLMGLAAVVVILGASIVWPIWFMLVHAFLPRRAAKALLEWQRSASDRVSTLARS